MIDRRGECVKLDGCFERVWQLGDIVTLVKDYAVPASVAVKICWVNQIQKLIK